MGSQAPVGVAKGSSVADGKLPYLVSIHASYGLGDRTNQMDCPEVEKAREEIADKAQAPGRRLPDSLAVDPLVAMGQDSAGEGQQG